MPTEKTRRVVIVHRDEDIARLRDLLEDLGCSVRILRLEAEGDEEHVAKADSEEVVVVVIEEGSANDEELDSVVIDAQSKSCRIVGVWGGRSSEPDKPKSIGMYADATVTIRKDQLEKAVTDEEDLWCDVVGDQLPERPIPRYKC